MQALGRRLVHADHPGRAARRALQIPHRRRDRGARSGLALPARRRARPERGDRSGATTGRPRLERPAWHECVFLELHVGTFTPQGTFRGVIDKLDHVADAGFTAIELMPVADFPGRWNWGYDGVLLFRAGQRLWPAGRSQGADRRRAPARPHGVSRRRLQPLRPGGELSRPLRAAVLLARPTRPGATRSTIEKPEVRRFAVENALYWLDDFRFDGLRLDAVHAIAEPGRTMLLDELSEAAGRLAAETGRHIHLVLENDANQASLLDPLDRSAARQISRAMERRLSSRLSCAADRRDRRAITATIASRRASRRGRWPKALPIRASLRRIATASRAAKPTSALPATAFVNFLQNHDQIGNRALRRAAVDAGAARSARSGACRSRCSRRRRR